MTRIMRNMAAVLAELRVLTPLQGKTLQRLALDIEATEEETYVAIRTLRNNLNNETLCFEWCMGVPLFYLADTPDDAIVYSEAVSLQALKRVESARHVLHTAEQKFGFSPIYFRMDMAADIAENQLSAVGNGGIRAMPAVARANYHNQRLNRPLRYPV